MGFTIYPDFVKITDRKHVPSQFPSRQIIKHHFESNNPAVSFLKKYPHLPFSIFFAGYLGIILLTFQDYGITWDENLHRQYGDYILNYYTSFFKDTSALTYSNLYYYGGFFDILCALIKKISSLGEYETRHLVNALFGSLGLIFLYLLTLEITASAGTAFLSALFLALSPKFYGHSFNNPKDIPFAVLYLLSVYMICVSIKYWDGRFPKKLILGMALGFGLCMGVRVGGLMVAIFFPLFYGLFALFRWWRGEKVFKILFQETAYNILTVASFSYLITLLSWPWAQTYPLRSFYKAIQVMSQFPQTHKTLFEGTWLFSDQVPWYYIPKWLMISTPLTVLAGVVIFFACLPFLWNKLDSPRKWSLSILICATLFPVIYAIRMKMKLHNGIRHFLFLIPLMCCLAAIGYDYLVLWLNRIGTGWNSDKVKRVVVVLLSISLTPVLHWQARSHPNQYVYFNSMVGGLKGAYGKYDTDYWGNSYKEAAEWLNDFVKTNREEEGHADKKYTVLSCGYPLSTMYYLDKDLFIYTTAPNEKIDFFLQSDSSLCQVKRGTTRTLHAIKIDDVPIIEIRQ